MAHHPAVCCYKPVAVACQGGVEVKAAFLVTIDGDRVECRLGCNSFEAQEALEPIALETRLLVERALSERVDSEPCLEVERAAIG